MTNLFKKVFNLFALILLIFFIYKTYEELVNNQVSLEFIGTVYYIFIGYPLTFLSTVLLNNIIFKKFDISVEILDNINITNQSYIANLLPIPGRYLVLGAFLKQFNIKLLDSSKFQLILNFQMLLFSVNLYLLVISNYLFLALLFLITGFFYLYQKKFVIRILLISLINLINFSISYYLLFMSLDFNEAMLVSVSSILSGYFSLVPNGLGIREVFAFYLGEYFSLQPYLLVLGVLFMRLIGLIFNTIIFIIFKIKKI
jgi:hypothetical protein